MELQGNVRDENKNKLRCLFGQESVFGITLTLLGKTNKGYRKMPLTDIPNVFEKSILKRFSNKQTVKIKHFLYVICYKNDSTWKFHNKICLFQ
jgi:hypothetical protein